jgi:hypothetical protein
MANTCVSRVPGMASGYRRRQSYLTLWYPRTADNSHQVCDARLACENAESSAQHFHVVTQHGSSFPVAGYGADKGQETVLKCSEHSMFDLPVSGNTCDMQNPQKASDPGAQTSLTLLHGDLVTLLNGQESAHGPADDQPVTSCFDMRRYPQCLDPARVDESVCGKSPTLSGRPPGMPFQAKSAPINPDNIFIVMTAITEYEMNRCRDTDVYEWAVGWQDPTAIFLTIRTIDNSSRSAIDSSACVPFFRRLSHYLDACCAQRSYGRKCDPRPSWPKGYVCKKCKRNPCECERLEIERISGREVHQFNALRARGGWRRNDAR